MPVTGRDLIHTALDLALDFSPQPEGFKPAGRAKSLGELGLHLLANLRLGGGAGAPATVLEKGHFPRIAWGR